MTTLITALRLGWRLLRRDLRAGEIRVLLASLILAVTAVTSVDAITDRAGRALDLQANALLGGDAVLRSDRPPAAELRVEAERLGLRHTEVRQFPSMLRVGEQLKLADLRAVDGGYPLRGEIVLAAEQGVAPASGIPARGELWLSAAGARQLAAQVGQQVQIGQLSLRLAAIVEAEPDAALDYFEVAPRVYFNLADLAATGLEQPGSRIGYRVIVAGAAAAVEQWVATRRSQLDRGQRLETAADARPEIRRALERADQFLGLAALVAVVLAAVAVVMAVRRHVAHHLDGCAVLRCLGASQSTIVIAYASELVWVGVLASMAGVALAFGLQTLIVAWLQAEIGIEVPPAGFAPALYGSAVAFVVLLGFALPPVFSLRRVPAMRVLRRDLGPVGSGSLASGVLGLGGLAALMSWKAGSGTLGAVVLGGIAATAASLMLLAALLVWVLRSLRSRLHGSWRYGIAALGRRGGSSVLQVTALGLGLMVLVLLSLVRSELIGRWRESLPADAPNRFIVNVQPDQLEAVRQQLAAGGVDDVVLYPMVRGRWQRLNDEAVDIERFDGRARRLAEREFNLSSASTLSDDNEIVAGQFWGERIPESTEFSVEEGIARTLGWKLGDRLLFDLAGSPLEGTISSLRRVEWESFRPNFFVLISPGALAGQSASHITAVHLPRERAALTDELVRRHPNLSVIDIDAVISKVRRTADQVAAAVEYVFYFTVLAGLLVLFAAITASQDERLLEGGVMRAFGASRWQLRAAHAAEFAAIGGLAGVTAAVAAILVSGAVAREVLDLPFRPQWMVALTSAAAGLLLVGLSGLWMTRRIVAAPPATTLRALQG